LPGSAQLEHDHALVELGHAAQDLPNHDRRWVVVIREVDAIRG
jgi:hypothetical protein